MKRIGAAFAAASIGFLVVVICGGPSNADSQTAGQTPASASGHEHHGQGDQAKTAPAVAAPAAGNTATLPGVPPGRPARGGGVTTTITGEVMDPACFLEAGPKSIGKGHYQCAIDCAKSGQTLALFDRANDRIYFIAGELPGENPNVPLMPYIHEKVDVLGTVYHRSQAWGIVIIKVERHKEK